MMALKAPTLSPMTIVCTTALIVIAAFVVANYFGLGAKVVDPQVTMESGRSAAGKQGSVRQAAIPTVIDGEVVRTAERITEATALTFSAGLYAANEQLRGRTPRTVRDLLDGVARQKLMPPGLAFTQVEGVLASSCPLQSAGCGTLSVRYRPVPLGIEVVSIGSKPQDGPALIVRLPDETSDQGEAKLFIADSLTVVKVPDPFAPAAVVIASGWSPERWRSLNK
jgi:hypothetical protein